MSTNNTKPEGKEPIQDVDIKYLIYYGYAKSDPRLNIDKDDKGGRIDNALICAFDLLKSHSYFNPIAVEQIFWGRIKALAELNLSPSDHTAPQVEEAMIQFKRDIFSKMSYGNSFDTAFELVYRTGNYQITKHK